METLGDFDFDIIHVPGKTNVLADTLSRIYSDEPKGTVRTTSEFISTEEEHLPSELLLNLVTTPLYTGTPMFLGVTRQQSSARQAFPNAKKVILKLTKVTARSLEGKGTKEMVSLTEANEPTTDEPISRTSTELDTSDSAEDDCHDYDIPPQPNHTYSCLLAHQENTHLP